MTFLLPVTHVVETGHTFIADVNIHDGSDPLQGELTAKLATHDSIIPDHVEHHLGWVEGYHPYIPDAYPTLFTPPPEAALSFLS